MWWHRLQVELASLAAIETVGAALKADPSAVIAPSAILDTANGPIVIGARTRVGPGAFIQGPVVIGDDCLVGNMSMVRGPAWIGDGTRIGFSAEIKAALIEERVTIGPQCFVADSIVEVDAYLGAQVRTSNHRLDGQSVQVMVDGQRQDTGFEKLGCCIGAKASLGIQVIVLPGREVAPGSLIEPRITIEKNLPSGRYRLSQQLQSF